MKLKSLLLAVFALFAIIADAQEVLNQTDVQGKKQGNWVKKFENGQERYRGEFKDDKPVGTFFYYYDDGAKSSEVVYLGADGTAANAKFFHKNGTIMGEGKYLNQQKDGKWKYCDDQSMLSSIDNYKNGKLNGMNKVFFLNGNVAAEIPFVDGLKNGDFVEYFSDGTIKMQGTYQDNTYTGNYFQNYADGKLMVEGEYKVAVKDGLWKYFADDGRLKAQQVYETGELIKEKIEPGFEPDQVPIEIEEKEKIDEVEMLDQYYKEYEQGK